MKMSRERIEISGSVKKRRNYTMKESSHLCSEELFCFKYFVKLQSPVTQTAATLPIAASAFILP
jgi:hypothetical protein